MGDTRHVQNILFRKLNIKGKPWLISNLTHKICVYLHIIRLLKPNTYFEHYPAHIQEVYVVTVYMRPLVSSLSAGDCLVHRLRRNSSWRSTKVIL
jgi:hypothetical protein